MSTHPFIPLYVDDYDAATAHLTIEEDGVYSRLIRLCWRTPGCSLPNDHAWIARKIRISPEDWERIGAPLIKEFFTPIRGRLIQKRLKREYDDISRKKMARQNAGKSGGLAKAAKAKENMASNATVLPPDTRAFPEPEPIEEESPIAPKGATPPKIILRQAHVEAVWQATPDPARSRTSKADIQKALQAAARRGHHPDLVLSGILAYYATPSVSKEDHAYAKGAHRIISADRWKDSLETKAARGAAKTVSPDERWRRAMRSYKASQYWNATDNGPRPGRPDCLVPAAILEEFGFAPMGGLS